MTTDTGVPPLDRSLSPADCLGATPVIEANAPTIRALANRMLGEVASPRARAVRAFELVRDQFRYEFRAKLTLEEYQASHILADGKGFCVQKAILLCALLRAVSVPAALVLCDLRDHSLPPRIVRAMGTDTMFHHGLTAIYLDGGWRLADASLSPDVVARKRYRTVEFDGLGDALFPSSTLDGSPHGEILKFHGMYADLPFEQMISAFMAAYATADVQALQDMGYRF